MDAVLQLVREFLEEVRENMRAALVSYANSAQCALDSDNEEEMRIVLEGIVAAPEVFDKLLQIRNATIEHFMAQLEQKLRQQK